jgi:hypothetical protein
MGSDIKHNTIYNTKTSEADPFRNTKIKTSYTLEDGHVGRNM